MPRMRLGIFGGSFDPFHAGHFLVAQAAMEEACLDRVFLFRPPSRPSSMTIKPVQPSIGFGG